MRIYEYSDEQDESIAVVDADDGDVIVAAKRPGFGTVRVLLPIEEVRKLRDALTAQLDEVAGVPPLTEERVREIIADAIAKPGA